MAAGDKTIKLKIVLTEKGIEVATGKLKALNVATAEVAKSTARVNNAENKRYRNLRGTAEATGNATKDFARMSQGLGGLVQAYATVAANVFALSSAFLVLRKTADLSSMQKSAEDFSNRFGVSVSRITKRIQEATGGALSFADALPTINKAISSGIGEEQITKLAVAATKASQTFGGTANEALNRFISASQRGRVEIVQTLGIVINTEKAYRDYAASIGKTAQELTQANKQLAIQNAIIAESENVFDQVNIDPNPFQQLLTTVVDLKDVISVFITDSLTPMVNAFNQSKAAALALIALIVGSVAGRIFPEIGKEVELARKKGLEASKQARAALKEAESKKAALIAESEKIVTFRTKKELTRRVKNFEESLKTQQNIHASFQKNILNADRTFNAAVIQERRAAIARQLKALETGKGILSGLPTNVVELKKQDAILTSIAAKYTSLPVAINKAAAAQAVFGNVIKTTEARIAAFSASMKASFAVAGSAFRSGFGQTFAIASQGQVIKSIRAMSTAWIDFVARIVTGGATVRGVMRDIGRAAGRTAGTIAGLFAKALSALTSITLALSIGAFIWEKYGDKIRGISPAQRAVIDASKEFKEELEEINKRASEGIIKLGDNAPQSLKKVTDALLFTAGTFDSVSEAINRFRSTVVNSLQGLTTEEARAELEQLRKKIEEIRTRAAKDFGGAVSPNVFLPQERDLRLRIKELESILNTAGSETATIAGNTFATAYSLAIKAGFREANLQTVLSDELLKAIPTQNLFVNVNLTDQLVESLKTGGIDEFKQTLEGLRDQFSNTDEFNKFSEAVLKAIESFSGITGAVARAGADASNELKQITKDIDTFALGIEKLTTASVPDKEIINFLQNTKNALTQLKVENDKIPNDLLVEKLGGEQELVRIKQLLGTVGDNFNLEQLLDAATGKLDVLYARVKSQLLISEQLKVVQIEQANNSARQLKTDEIRVDQVKENLRLQKAINRLNISNLEKEAEAQAAVLKSKQGFNESAIDLQIQEAKLAVILAELDAERQRSGILAENLDVERKRAEIRLEELDGLKSVNNILLQSNAVALRLVEGVEEETKLRKFGLQLSKRELELQKLEVQEKINSLNINAESREQDIRAEQSLRARLTLLEAQTLELQRQDLIIKSRELADAGQEFSKEGAKIFGQFFRRELEDSARGLETTLETLGKGFAKTVQTSLDSVVEYLITTGSFSRFGRTLKEAVQAGLREAFAEAINNRIKEALANVFKKPEEAKSPEVVANEQRKTLIETMVVQNGAIEENTKALRDSISAKASFSATGTMEGGQITQTSGLLENFGEDMLSEQQKTTATNEAVEAAIGLLNKNSEGWFGTLTGTISKLLSSIFGGGQETGGGFGNVIGSIVGSIFGLAQGGVVPSMKRVNSYAYGGLTSGPELAVIGEGKNREAVVPLPNNREIPVDLKGTSGDTIMIEQKFDFRNADSSAVDKLRAEARNIEQRTFNRVFTEINKGGKYAKISGRR